ncbi:beta/alpha barrel domain-containing protein [Chromobacterium rhizoryzae]|uniref:hypothetical protein n=1 Tax=Chromobacterium rhizoryzae TaxID=1778675 RepID=UPI001D093CD8|nr:hypothetical protein [Chromobacterium rhizoryzae]
MTAYQVCGLPLLSPLIVGSGPITDNERNIRRFLRAGAGAVVTKTIHPKPPKDNDEKVIAIPSGWLNSTTYSQRPVSGWITILSRLAADNAPVMASIHADSPGELASLAAAIATTGCQALELGISCLNEAEKLMDTPKRVFDYALAVRRAVKLPFSVKLAISSTLRQRVDAAISAGANAITLSDTVLGLAVDPRTSQIRLGGAYGYSGPGIRPLVQAAIYELRKTGVSIPIFGSGGVMSSSDAIEYLCIGANAVQIYSVLQTKNHSVAQISTGITQLLAERQIPLSQLIGSSLYLEEQTC